MRAIALIALLSLSCYQTSTSDGKTTRTNTLTGKSERLVGDRWSPIKEATPAARPVSLGPLDGKPCPPEIKGLAEAATVGCIFNRSGSTLPPQESQGGHAR